MTGRGVLFITVFTALSACSGAPSEPDAASTAYMPTEVAVLASNEMRPDGIVGDENAVYFTTQTMPSFLRKLDLRTHSTTTLVSDIGDAIRIAEDADHVYVGTSTGTDSRIIRIDKATGASTDLVTGQFLARMAVVVGDSVYWESDTDTQTMVRSIKNDGSGLRDVVSFPNDELSDMVVDDTHVYAFLGARLVAIDKATGATTTLASGVDGPECDLAQGADELYWSDRTDNTIKALPKSGGTPVTLASNQSRPGRLAVADDRTVYWAVHGSTDPGSTTLGAMRKLPAGTNEVVDIATGLDHAVEPTLLSHAVIWTVYGPFGGPTTAGGSIMAAPR